MEKTTEPRKERKSTATIRKGGKHGQVTQKMMSFRIDAENVEKLEAEPNKGRLINKLLQEHYASQQEA